MELSIRQQRLLEKLLSKLTMGYLCNYTPPEVQMLYNLMEEMQVNLIAAKLEEDTEKDS